MPWEDRIAISHELKKTKYQDLIGEASIKGWNAVLFPIEVGCHSFPATSVCCLLQKTELEPRRLRKAAGEVAVAAETSLRWLWLQVKADFVFAAPLR